MLPLPFCAIFSIVAFCIMNYISEGSRPHSWDDVFNDFASPLLPLRNFRNKSYFLALNCKVNWFDAVNFCDNIHMKLLSIRSQVENDQIRKFIEDAGTSTFSGEQYEYWTGGSRLIDVDHWLWFPYGEEIVYTSWGQNQPTDHHDHHCLYLVEEKINYTGGENELYWNKGLCDVKLNFICERYDEEPFSVNL